jgi:hypothetical protein
MDDEERTRALRRLGTNLGRHMEALAVTDAELADRTDLTRERIGKILTAEVEAGALEVMFLAAALGILPDELFEGWDEGGEPLLAEADYELPLLKAYAGGRREGGRPVEDSVGELVASRLTEADHEVDPGGRERWVTRLRLRQRLLLDTGLVGFDPHLRIWDLTPAGEARLRELELSDCKAADTTGGPPGAPAATTEKRKGSDRHE